MATPFGRYLLESKLASGGMGEVFLARMRGAAGFEKKVVIKRVLPHLAESTEFVERFLDEGRLVVQLSHGNLAHVFDMGQVDQHYYLAMEYIDGLDLRQLLQLIRTRQDRMPEGLVLHIIAELAKGLAYAHGRTDDQGRNLGIIHRDVSPSNVMVSREGEVKLLDFGIAKAAGRMAHSLSGSLHGKFLYMSPEQAAGRSLDARSDLFSVGTLAYEMLTGVRPFQGASELRTLDLIRAGRYERPQRHRPDLSDGAVAILTRCLQLDPEARFESADALHRATLATLMTRDDVVSNSDLATFLESYLAGKTATQPVSLDAALNQQLDALLAGPSPSDATQAAAGTPLPDGTAPFETGAARRDLSRTHRSGPIAIRPDTSTTSRTRLEHLTDADVPRASRNRILIASVLLLVGVLVTLNVIMLYALRSSTSDPNDPAGTQGAQAAAAEGLLVIGAGPDSERPETAIAILAAQSSSSDNTRAASKKDTAEEDTAGEDTAEEDTAEEDTAEEDTAGEDTAGEDTATDAKIATSNSQPEPSTAPNAALLGPPVADADRVVMPAPRLVRFEHVPAGATVRLDGRKLTARPDGSFEIPPGTGPAKLVVKATGYRDMTVPVERTGPLRRVSEHLTAVRRSVKVTVHPSEAQIYAGKRKIGVGQATVSVTIENPARGSATLAGYADARWVARFGQRAVSVTLKPHAMGAFQVRIFPVSADVQLDDAPLSRQKALVSRKVRPGEHRLIIRAGGKARTIHFTVQAGDTKRLGQVTLE